MLLPGPATTTDAALIAIAEAAPSGSPPSTALGPAAAFANMQAIELNTTPAASHEVLIQLQQVAQGATSASNVAASNGPLPAHVADLINAQNPAADVTNAVDVFLGISHHDFLIHV